MGGTVMGKLDGRKVLTKADLLGVGGRRHVLILIECFDWLMRR